MPSLQKGASTISPISTCCYLGDEGGGGAGNDIWRRPRTKPAILLEAVNEEKTMPVPASSVQVGEYFITATKQLRKVTKLDQDDQGQGQVYYFHKSTLIPGRRFDSGHVTANPVLLETFAGLRQAIESGRNRRSSKGRSCSCQRVAAGTGRYLVWRSIATRFDPSAKGREVHWPQAALLQDTQVRS